MIQILYKKIDDSVLIAWGNAPGKPQRGDINIASESEFSEFENFQNKTFLSLMFILFILK